MFVTRNRAGDFTILFLALAVLVTGCGPPGPRAVWKGRKRLESGQTVAAIAEFQLAASLMPTNAAVWNYLGLAYHRAGQVTNAFEAYSRAIRLDRDLLEARFNLGCLWLDENRPEAAAGELIAYTLRRGNFPEGWLKLGSAQWRAHDVAGADKSFHEALRLQTNNVEALNGLGLVRWQRNQPREAAALFQEALRWQPDYRPALLNLALVSQQQLHDRPEALRRFREYLALQPRPADWDTVNAIAATLEPLAGRPAPARPETSHSPAAKAEVAPAPTNPAKPLVSEATTKPAIAPTPASNALVAKPASSAAPPASGSTRVASRLETEKRAPEPAAQAAPPGVKPVVASSHPAALPDAEPASSSKPARTARSGSLPKPDSSRNDEPSPDPQPVGDRERAEVAFGQGQQALRANRLAEALQSFRRAAQLDPAYYEAHYNLGLTAFKLRSFEVALAAWEQAVALRPRDADPQYNLALTLKASGEAQAAADELEKLLALHPDEARAHLTLGNLYAEPLRDIPRARRHYQRVLQLDPRNPQALAIRYWLVAHPG